MKYIKEYIDFNDWDDEEEDNSIPSYFIGHEDFYNFLLDNNALSKWIIGRKKKDMPIGVY